MRWQQEKGKRLGTHIEPPLYPACWNPSLSKNVSATLSTYSAESWLVSGLVQSPHDRCKRCQHRVRSLVAIRHWTCLTSSPGTLSACLALIHAVSILSPLLSSLPEVPMSFRWSLSYCRHCVCSYLLDPRRKRGIPSSHSSATSLLCQQITLASSARAETEVFWKKENKERKRKTELQVLPFEILV